MASAGQLPLEKAAYVHIYKGTLFAHSGGHAYWFDNQSMRIISCTPSPVQSEPGRPWETRCVQFEGKAYGVYLGKLWRFMGPKAEEVCEAPEVHASQLFSDGKRLLYLSRYGHTLYEYCGERGFCVLRQLNIQPGSIPYVHNGRCFATTLEGRVLLQFDAQFSIIRRLEGLYSPQFFGALVLVCQNGALVDLDAFQRYQCAGPLPNLMDHLRISPEGDWGLHDRFFSYFPGFRLGRYKWNLQISQTRPKAPAGLLRSPSAGSLDVCSFGEQKSVTLKEIQRPAREEYIEKTSSTERLGTTLGKLKSKTLQLEGLLDASFPEHSEEEVENSRQKDDLVLTPPHETPKTRSLRAIEGLLERVVALLEAKEQHTQG